MSNTELICSTKPINKTKTFSLLFYRKYMTLKVMKRLLEGEI